MANSPRILELLEEILDSGKTPEDVCRDCPDLLPEVQQRWQNFCLIDAQVRTLLPGLKTNSRTHATSSAQPYGVLPRIPGYEIDAVIGRGGMGVVYKARHLALKRTVALKMLATTHPHPSQWARFQMEAEAVARLQHPNIVQIYEIGEIDGRPFIALEYVTGGSLAKRMKEQALSPFDAARLVATLGEAMQLAHSRNLIHRDLKPGNVLLSGEPNATIGHCQPKVSDFGLVRQLDADSGQTFDGMVVGTPSYMAPEQAEGRGHSAGPAADVYALGAILYECLTARPPFEGASADETLDLVRRREPAAPSSLNRQVPRDLETICLKCLRKESDRRYSSARELAEDLERFLAHRPILARPMGRLERTAKWARRRPAEAALIVAAVLLLVGGIAAAVWYVDDRGQRHLDQVLRDTEIQNRSQQMNHQVSLALDDADKFLQEIRSQLQNPVKTAAWRSDPDLWQSTLEKMRQALHRAQTAVLGTQEALEPSTETRLGLVSAELEKEENNFAMAKELDDIQLLATGPVKGKTHPTIVIPKYTKFFADHGMDIVREDKSRLASAINKSPIRFVLVAALDHWAECTTYRDAENPELLQKLLTIASTADPDPWRDRFRDYGVWCDTAKLAQLANEVEAEEQPSSVLAALGALLEPKEGNPSAFYKRALMAHPRDFWLHLNAATSEANRKDTAGLYIAALAVRPKSSLAYYYLGISLYEQNDYKGADVACHKAIELNPNYSEAYSLVGLVRKGLKDLPASIAAFNKSIELDPKNADAYTGLGSTLRKLEDLPAAVAAYKKAIELDPKNADAYTGLGCALRELEDLANAVVAHQKAIELDPKNAYAYYALGYTLFEQKNLAGAITAYKKAIELDPKDADAYYELGYTLFEQKDLTEAITAYKKAIELDPNFAYAFCGLGNALREKKQFEEAITNYKQAINLDPKYADSYHYLAWVLATCEDAKNRDGKQAIRYAIKACELSDWKSGSHRATLAAAYAEAGDFEKAIKYQTDSFNDPVYEEKYGNNGRKQLDLYKQMKPFHQQP